MPNINDPAAETSSVLDLFQHVFIPTYDYDASLGEMKVSLNISNVNALYVDQLQYQGVGVGDTRGNFSIGTSNTGSFALFSNTIEIGFATGRNLASGSNVIVFGNYALQSGNVASDSVVLGTFAAEQAVTTQNAVIIGHAAGNVATNLSGSVIIGEHTCCNIGSAIGSVVIGDRSCQTGDVVNSVILGADVTAFHGGQDVFMVGNTLLTGRFDCNAIAVGKEVDITTTYELDVSGRIRGDALYLAGHSGFTLDVSGNTNLSGNIHIAGTLAIDGSSINIDVCNGKLILTGDNTDAEAFIIQQGGQAIENGYLGINFPSASIGFADPKLNVSGNSVFYGNVTISGNNSLSLVNGTCDVTALNNTAEFILTVSEGGDSQQLVLHPATTNFNYVLNNSNVFTANNTGFILSNGNMQLHSNLTVSGTSVFRSNVTICGELTGETSATIEKFVKVNGEGNRAYIAGQGAYLSWNNTPGAGRTDIACQRGTGGGGFEFSVYDNSNNLLNQPIVTSVSNVTVSGTLTTRETATFNSNVSVTETLSVVNGSGGSNVFNAIPPQSLGYSAYVLISGGTISGGSFGPVIVGGGGSPIISNIGPYFDFATTTISGIPLSKCREVKCKIGGDQEIWSITTLNDVKSSNFVGEVPTYTPSPGITITTDTANNYVRPVLMVTTSSGLTPPVHVFPSVFLAEDAAGPILYPSDFPILECSLYPAIHPGFQLTAINNAPVSPSSEIGFNTSQTNIWAAFFPVF